MTTIKRWTTPLLVGMTIPAFLLASVAFAAQDGKTVQRTQTMPQERMESRQPSAAHVYKASQLIGATVENAQGDNLGKIHDVVIDPADGSIAYAVMAAGGFLGLGEKYFAIPWRAFQPQVDADGEIEQLGLQVEKERFQKAPGFAKDQWPDMANPTWGQNIHAYYGQEEYWAHRQAMRQAGSDAMTSQRAPGASAQDGQTGMAATVQSVQGTTVELQVPQALVKDIQAGDRVEVSVPKQSQAKPTHSDGMKKQSAPSTDTKTRH